MADIVLSRLQAHVERVRTNCNHLDDIHFQEVYSRNGLINFILINVFLLIHIRFYYYYYYFIIITVFTIIIIYIFPLFLKPIASFDRLD